MQPAELTIEMQILFYIICGLFIFVFYPIIFISIFALHKMFWEIVLSPFRKLKEQRKRKREEKQGKN